MAPLPVGLSAELDDAAADSLQTMQQEQARKQSAWLHDGEMAQYAIKGSEADWQAALSGGPKTSVSMKGDAPTKKKGKKSGREGGSGGGQKRQRA